MSFYSVKILQCSYFSIFFHIFCFSYKYAKIIWFNSNSNYSNYNGNANYTVYMGNTIGIVYYFLCIQT